MTSGQGLTLKVELFTDLPSNSIVKIVGAHPALGWEPASSAAALTFDGTAASFIGTVTLPTTARGSEWKVVAKDGSAPEKEWVWMPGPNRLLEDSPVAVRLHWVAARDGTLVIAADPYLEAHRTQLRTRYSLFAEALGAIEALGGGLDKFSRGWEHFGLNRVLVGGQSGIMFREWAPAARAISIVGDFNGWNAASHVCKKDEFGVFSLFIPDLPSGVAAVPHNTFVKLSVTLSTGETAFRLPAWSRYAVYDRGLNEYVSKHWDPPAGERHEWRHPRPELPASVADDYRRVPGIAALPSRTDWLGAWPAAAAAAAAGGAGASGAAAAVTAAAPPSSAAAAGLRVYEAHVGMSSDEPHVASYRHFADRVLPRIAALGYNCVQLMAVLEHAYYGSFGYHVTSFMAPSSRCGSPEDLKYLVDAAHGLGLLVIMDMVHSHAAKNVNDGLNRFDGTDHQYFHAEAGGRGSHALWDSRLFDYSKLEVQRFLLSSARLYVDEFRFDGYRFDGVTSMMYLHHGLSVGFSGDYNEYFGDSTDLSAVVYLMLVNHMLHSMSPPCISIAEDVSGMPTLGRPVWEGGVGFDYRLAMAIPDKWIKMLKEQADEEWDVGDLVHTLVNRRWQEKAIAYAESHDQALVGDKTLAFWLMDKDMYWHMSTRERPMHPVIDRGIALHKMIRLITYALGGEGYLNFMGNEFGHPEWIDFPRAGNAWCYQHCRRQWRLVDDPALLYGALNAFDGAMQRLEAAFPWLTSKDSYVSLKHEADKTVVFERGTASGTLLFVFNFHASKSFVDYRVGAPAAGEWTLALDSDWAEFAGHGRVDRDTVFRAQAVPWHERPCSLQVYSPCRSVQVYQLRAPATV